MARLSDIQGIDVGKLKAVGSEKLKDLRIAGKTPECRKELAAKIGLPEDVVSGWVDKAIELKKAEEAAEAPPAAEAKPPEAQPEAKKYRLRDLTGLDEAALSKLKAAGIEKLKDLRLNAKTPEQRQDLAGKIGLSAEQLEAWYKQAVEFKKLEEAAEAGAAQPAPAAEVKPVEAQPVQAAAAAPPPPAAEVKPVEAKPVQAASAAPPAPAAAAKPAEAKAEPKPAPAPTITKAEEQQIASAVTAVLAGIAALFESSFESTLKDYAAKNGWTLAQLNDKYAQLIFEMESGRTHQIDISLHDTTLEFWVPSGVETPSADDVAPIAAALLQRNSETRFGFWCVSDTNDGLHLGFMHNAELGLLDAEYFGNTVGALLQEVESFQDALASDD